MAVMVTAGATLSCPFGAVPCILLGSASILFSQLPSAMMNEVTPANITTFGLCSSLSNPTVASATAAALGVLTPMPCLPVIVGSWMNTRANILVKGVPAVTSDSTLTCAYGGNISVIQLAQTKVTVK